MSSCPGYSLEEYLSWCYDIVVEDLGETNTSLGIAEALGTATHRRPRMTAQQFAPIVTMFEPYRDEVERLLLNYEEEENGSWRDYAGLVFDFIPDEMDTKVSAYLATLKENKVENTPKKEYITKEFLASIRPYVVLPKIVKNFCDGLALIAAHSHFDTPQVDNHVKSSVSNLLRETAAAVVPGHIDYFTGNGPIARYLREHLIIEQMMETELSENGEAGIAPTRLVEMRKEIDEKFNYNPSGQLDSLEWKHCVQTIIELQNKFFTEEQLARTDLWKPTDPNQRITESGFYLYEDDRRVINLVFKVKDVDITICILADRDPMVNAFHEWEGANLNIYGICFFPGMFKAMTDEVGKIVQE